MILKKSVTTQTKRCHNYQNLVQTFFTASQPCSLLRGHTEHFWLSLFSILLQQILENGAKFQRAPIPSINKLTCDAV
jgi:hypothetical protein